MLTKPASLIMVLLMLMTGCVTVFDLLPLWREVCDLQVMIKARTQTFEEKKQQHTVLQNMTNIKVTEDLSALYHIMAASDVQVKSLVANKKQPYNDGRAAHFVASASYLAALGFIQVLNATPAFILLSAELKIPANDSAQLLFEGEVLWLHHPKSKSQLTNFPFTNAFCLSQGAYPGKSSAIPSMQGMHMLGFLQQGKKVRAIVKMSDGQLLTVEKNQLIGKEQARVVNISSQGVLMQINQQLTLYK